MKAFNKHGACIQPCTKGWKKEDKGECDLVLFFKVLCLLGELIYKDREGKLDVGNKEHFFSQGKKNPGMGRGVMQ